jgi:hypothetical protein
MKTVDGLPAEVAEALNVGISLGENHAFGLVAARCSAAQAQSIRRIREERLYRGVTPDWRDFCAGYLSMSGTQADRIIRLFEEFGPGYFELAQLTRISPETYRAIGPAVQDGALHFEGEVIELNPENARRVAAAIAELRKTAGTQKQKKQPRPLEPHERLARIDQRGSALIAELDELSRKESRGENWLQLTAIIARLRAALTRLEVENGL